MCIKERVEAVVKGNLSRINNTIRILTKIVEKLVEMSLDYESNCNEDGKLEVSEYLSLSQENYYELKAICKVEGIEIVTPWDSPERKNYVFQMQFF